MAVARRDRGHNQVLRGRRQDRTSHGQRVTGGAGRGSRDHRVRTVLSEQDAFHAQSNGDGAPQVFAADQHLVQRMQRLAIADTRLQHHPPLDAPTTVEDRRESVGCLGLGRLREEAEPAHAHPEHRHVRACRDTRRVQNGAVAADADQEVGGGHRLAQSPLGAVRVVAR